MSEHVPPAETGTESPQQPPPVQPQQAAPRRAGFPWMIAAGFGAGLVVGVVGGVMSLGGGAFGDAMPLPFMGFYSPFTTLLLIGLVGVAIWYVVSPSSFRQRRTRPDGDANEILRRRFAAGEINAEEYARMVEVLKRG